MLKLLIFPLTVLGLVVFDTLSKVTLLMAVVVSLMIYYCHDIFYPKKVSVQKINKRQQALVYAILFGAIMFSAYYLLR